MNNARQAMINAIGFLEFLHLSATQKAKELPLAVTELVILVFPTKVANPP